MKIKSIILSAGQGTRLAPLTDTMPKGMVPFCGVSLLERQINVLRYCGIKDITIIAGYKANKIKISETNIIKNLNYKNTNMVWSLFLAKKIFDGTSDIIISYGDIIYEPYILKKLLSEKASLSLTVDLKWKTLWSLRRDNPLDDVETLKLNDDGTLKEVGKKPKNETEIQGQYMGLIKILASETSRILDEYLAMDQKKNYDGQTFNNLYMTTFVQYLINRGNIFKAVLVKGGWLEVDTIEDLRRYEEMESSNALTKIFNVKLTEN